MNDNFNLIHCNKPVVICQQVNCQNVMGAGLSRALYKLYPLVRDKYVNSFIFTTKEDLFGRAQIFTVDTNIYVANLYTQFKYGSINLLHLNYTDYDKLCNALVNVSKNNPDKEIIIPANIGCGYSGGNWKVLEPMIRNLQLPNLHIMHTNVLIKQLKKKKKENERFKEYEER